jgi:hypothetical protein
VQDVVAAFTKEGVVAAVPGELVCARPAGQRVVAVATEQQGGGQRTVDFVERDRVVAGLAKDLDLSGIGDRGWAALDGDGSPFTRICPAASRVVTIVLSRVSPNSDST